jgi:hypothetical protein
MSVSQDATKPKRRSGSGRGHAVGGVADALGGVLPDLLDAGADARVQPRDVLAADGRDVILADDDLLELEC